MTTPFIKVQELLEIIGDFSGTRALFWEISYGHNQAKWELATIYSDVVAQGYLALRFGIKENGKLERYIKIATIVELENQTYKTPKRYWKSLQGKNWCVVKPVISTTQRIMMTAEFGIESARHNLHSIEYPNGLRSSRVRGATRSQGMPVFDMSEFNKQFQKLYHEVSVQYDKEILNYVLYSQQWGPLNCVKKHTC